MNIPTGDKAVSSPNADARRMRAFILYMHSETGRAIRPLLIIIALVIGALDVDGWDCTC